jgi:hypothetical protein
MATGTAALLLQANPRYLPEDVKARMIRGARQLSGYPENAQGHGRGDAYNTFLSAQGAPLGDEPVAEPPPITEPLAPAGCLPMGTLWSKKR